jgi:hypothetical protein
MPKKHVGTRYIERLFLHQVGSVGQIVCFGVPAACNIDPLFLILGGPSVFSIKSAPGQVMPYLCFCIHLYLRVM